MQAHRPPVLRRVPRSQGAALPSPAPRPGTPRHSWREGGICAWLGYLCGETALGVAGGVRYRDVTPAWAVSDSGQRPAEEAHRIYEGYRSVCEGGGASDLPRRRRGCGVGLWLAAGRGRAKRNAGDGRLPRARQVLA